MAGAGETPPPGEGAFPGRRCPNCGGPLTYESGRAFCASEGAFVGESPSAPPVTGPPPLVRERVLRATKRELHQLCAAYGLRRSGNKAELLARVLRYMDEHGIDLPPEGVAEAAVSPVPTEAPVAAIPEPEAPAEGPVRGAVERAPPEGEAVAALPEPPAESAPVPPEALGVDPARLRRDRRRFYAGVSLTILGGPGLALASLAHDVFRVPILGTAYEAFGPLNATFAGLGAAVLVAGIVLMGMGLRGGIAPAAGGA